MNNENEKVRTILKNTGAIISNSHIVYTSGLHGDTYINKDAVYPHCSATGSLCQDIAKLFVGDAVQVVIAPAVGGVILSQWVAYHLTLMSDDEVLSVYADRGSDGGSFVIKRGYDRLIAGKNVLVVDDIITTGRSGRKVVEAVRSHNGTVVGLGAICNRGKVSMADLGDVPKLEALLTLELDSWDPNDCPLCKKGVPINTDVGRGRELPERQKR